MKPDLRLKESGALNISTGHDIHATEAASAVAIKSAFKIVIKIKIALHDSIRGFLDADFVQFLGKRFCGWSKQT